MSYELWDTNARFFLGRFASEAEALRYVQRVLDAEGDAYAEHLELAIDEGGTQNLSGADLAAKVRRLEPLYEPAPPP